MTKREARDAMAGDIFKGVMLTMTDLDSLTTEEQEDLFDKVANIALTMANRFQVRADAVWVP